MNSMLALNVIPENLKKEIKLRQIYQFLKSLYGIVFIMSAVYAILLLAGLYLMQAKFVDTISKANLVVKNTENFSAKVKDANTQLNAIANIQKDFIKWSAAIKELTQNINQGIVISQLSLSKETGLFYLSGTAKTRDDLLLLKEDLEKLGFLSDINFPIKNLLEKNDIKFNISAKLLSYDFK